MASGVRSLKLDFRVLDKATKIIQNAKKDVLELEKKTIKPTLEARDKASKAIDNVTRSLKKADTASKKAGKELKGVGAAGSAASSGMNRAASGLSKIDKAAKSASASLRQARDRMDHFSDFEGGLTAAAAFSGASAILSANTAGAYQSYLKSIRNTTEGDDDYKKALAWIEEARNKSTTNRMERAQILAKTQVHTKGGLLDNETDLKLQFLSELEREIELGGAAADFNVQSLGGMESVLGSFFTGGYDTLNDLVQGFEINNDMIKEEIELLKKLNPQYADMAEEELGVYAATKLYTEFMQKEHAKIGDDFEDAMLPQTKFRLGMSELAITVGDTLTPALDIAIKAIRGLNKVISTVPGSGPFLGVGLAVTFLAASLSLLYITTSPAITAVLTLKKGLTLAGLAAKLTTVKIYGLSAASKAGAVGMYILGAASKVAAVGMGVLRFAMTLIALHPVGAVLLGIGMILLLVAQKTGILSVAWEKLIGLWDKLKTADISKLFGKALSVGIKVAFPIAMFKPIVSILGQMLEYLAKFHPLFYALHKIWENIDPILKTSLGKLIPTKLTGLIEAAYSVYETIKGWYDHITGLFEGLGKALEKGLSWLGIGEGDLTSEIVGKKAVEEAASQGLPGRYALATQSGIVSESSEGYRAARFQPVEGADPAQVEEILKRVWTEWGYPDFKTKAFYKPQFDKLTAEERSLFAFQGSVSTKINEKEMIKLGFEDYITIFESMTNLGVGKHTTADEVAEIADEIKNDKNDAWKSKSELEAEGKSTDDTPMREEFYSPPEESGLDNGFYNPPEESGLDNGFYDPPEESGLDNGFYNEPNNDDLTEEEKKHRETFWGLDKGGEIDKTGLLIGHEGEEYVPADVTVKTTAAERLVNTILQNFNLSKLVGGGGDGRPIVIHYHEHHNTVNVPTQIHKAPREMSRFDLERTVKKIVADSLGQLKT